MSADLCYLSAKALLQGFARKTLSPVDCMQAILERISNLNPVVNAFFFVDEKGAMAAARASEQRWKAGAPLGPLDGIPFSVKDHILTKDMPSVWGLNDIDAAGPWPVDAPIVARLKEAGAILIGKTTQPELAMLCSGVNGRYGTARNPWDLTKTPGGSSSGAAAALAAGMCPIAIGSDGGGSIRIPASYTGLIAHKPTFGRIPFFPPFGPGIVYGPMARTTTDIALVMNVATLPDWRDIYALPPEDRDYCKALGQGIEGMRLAYSENFGYGTPVSPEVRASAHAALETLRSQGATVEEIPPFFDFDLYNAIAPSVFSTLDKQLAATGSKVESLLPELQTVLRRSKGGSLESFFAAKAKETEARLTIAQALDGFDALVTPTMPTTAFEAELCFPKGTTLNQYAYTFEHNPFTWPFNVTLQPAISVPCGVAPSGLPIGLQIVGQRGADHICLTLGDAFLNASPDMPDWPQIDFHSRAHQKTEHRRKEPTEGETTEDGHTLV